MQAKQQTPRGLNPRHREFVRLVVAGMNQTQAYKQAISRNAKDTSAQKKSSALARSPKIAAYLRELKEATWTAEALSYAEKRATLAKIVRTPVGEVNENSPLAQEVKREDTEFGERVTVKIPSKLQAIEIDNKMAGHNYQDQPEYINNLFSGIVGAFGSGMMRQAQTGQNLELEE